MQFSSLLVQDQLRTLLLPALLGTPLLKIAVVSDRIIDPYPGCSSVHLEPGKCFSQIQRVQFQRKRSFVQARMVRCPWQGWLTFLFARCLPMCMVGEIGTGLANGIFDRGTSVHKGHI